MYSYSAYDLRLRSEFELSELPSVDADDAGQDIDIVRGIIDPVSVDGKAAMFLGPWGAGKSTTAGAFV
jgi:Fe-S cluster assembly ATPase SufC